MSIDDFIYVFRTGFVFGTFLVTAVWIIGYACSFIIKFIRKES